jgi:hypothetical protein
MDVALRELIQMGRLKKLRGKWVMNYTIPLRTRI